MAGRFIATNVLDLFTQNQSQNRRAFGGIGGKRLLEKNLSETLPTTLNYCAHFRNSASLEDYHACSQQLSGRLWEAAKRVFRPASGQLYPGRGAEPQASPLTPSRQKRICSDMDRTISDYFIEFKIIIHHNPAKCQGFAPTSLFCDP